jgi:hypothetical protein
MHARSPRRYPQHATVGNTLPPVPRTGESYSSGEHVASGSGEVFASENNLFECAHFGFG